MDRRSFLASLVAAPFAAQDPLEEYILARGFPPEPHQSALYQCTERFVLPPLSATSYVMSREDHVIYWTGEMRQWEMVGIDGDLVGS